MPPQKCDKQNIKVLDKDRIWLLQSVGGTNFFRLLRQRGSLQFLHLAPLQHLTKAPLRVRAFLNRCSVHRHFIWLVSLYNIYRSTDFNTDFQSFTRTLEDLATLGLPIVNGRSRVKSCLCLLSLLQPGPNLPLHLHC